MFSTPYSLKKRTGKFDLERGPYLRQLVDEYRADETDEEKKEQVLANLGNFAYDPINYEYFRRFNVIDIFLENLNEYRSSCQRKQHFNLNLLAFSVAAICNLCLDHKNKVYLLKQDALRLVAYCLCVSANQSNVEIVLNILTFLIFIRDETTRDEILNYNDENIHLLALVKSFSSSPDKRLSNLASVFLQEFSVSS